MVGHLTMATGTAAIAINWCSHMTLRSTTAALSEGDVSPKPPELSKDYMYCQNWDSQLFTTWDLGFKMTWKKHDFVLWKS